MVSPAAAELDDVEVEAVGVAVVAFVVGALVGVALLLVVLAVGCVVVGVLVEGATTVGWLDAEAAAVLAVPSGAVADLENVRSTQYWLACQVLVGK